MRYPLLALAGLLLSAGAAFNGSGEFFQPKNRLTGVGIDRERLTETTLDVRTEQMVESQTFTILRDPRALAGAERINSPKLRRLFERASDDSGFPATTLAAIAYLESWGVANEESPTGPKGIMQIAEGTARSMGLQIVRKTRYRVSKERRLVRSKSKKKGAKPRYRTVTVRTPYTVLVRDDRMNPERAVPAAARYLARIESKFGGRDWAIFAYHCGEGCVGGVRSITNEPTVAGAFFASHPGHKRELYETMKRHMDRDYSPTYFFRIRRAEQLLAMHREDPAAFRALFNEYRNRIEPNGRAPHRLSVWLRPEDFEFQNCEDLRRNLGGKLARALDNPSYFGFSLRKNIAERDPANRDLYLQATPSALGTLAYIAFETRRLHDAMNRRGERFVPLEVTALVTPRDYEERFLRTGSSKEEFASHCSGQVFDISTSNLPAGEREALEFVLDDLGYHGYLGFVDEHTASGTLHVGPSPSARDFFAKVWNEAIAAARDL